MRDWCLGPTLRAGGRTGRAGGGGGSQGPWELMPKTYLQKALNPIVVDSVL